MHELDAATPPELHPASTLVIRSRAAWPLLLLCLLTGLVFSPVLRANFLLWDDNINITRNPLYRPVSWSNTLQFWFTTYNHTYRPLVHTAWAGIAWLSSLGGPHPIPGADPSPFDARVFHAIGLGLHLVNVLLVWRLARRWTSNPWAAAGGVALFAMHPVQVESLGWVTGFNEILCATFCLLSMGEYLRHAEVETEKFKPYVLATLWYVLALLTKPAAVALPLVLAVLDNLILRRDFRLTIRALAGWLVAGGIFAALTALIHPESYAGVPPPLGQRPFIAGDALAFYLGKLLYPHPLGIDYGRKPSVVMAQPWVWVAWLIPVAVFAAAWRYRKRSPWPLVALLGGLAWLLPVLGFTPFHFQLMFSTVADRYLYFVLAFAAIPLARGLERASWKNWGAGYLALVLLWAGLSWRQSATWENNFTCFAQTIRTNPASWLAHADLAEAYNHDGRRAEARREYEAALAANPDLWEMHVMLARYAEADSDAAEARRHWLAVVTLQPVKSGRKGAEAALREALVALVRS